MIVFEFSSKDKAVVLLSGTANVTGKVTFTETSNGVLVEGQIVGLSPGNHGFHIHALGDLSNGCTSTGAHFNPENVSTTFMWGRWFYVFLFPWKFIWIGITGTNKIVLITSFVAASSAFFENFIHMNT